MAENKNTCVALGTFDGLHLGHIEVIKRAKQAESKGLKPIVLMFGTHPQRFLEGKAPTTLLDDISMEDEFKKLGVETRKIDFSDVRNMSGKCFVSEILKKEMNAKELFCGFNYRFAKDAEADAEELKTLAAEYGMEVTICDPVMYKGEPISSTRIRKCVEEGEMEDANAMLGRRFCYTLNVVKGDARGKKLEFPTINQFFPPDFTVPKLGVYSSYTRLSGGLYRSMTNVGVRPTIGMGSVRSETAIFDFSGDLYGESVRVELEKFIREEKKFDSLDELKKQLQSDKKMILEI